MHRNFILRFFVLLAITALLSWGIGTRIPSVGDLHAYQQAIISGQATVLVSLGIIVIAALFAGVYFFETHPLLSKLPKAEKLVEETDWNDLPDSFAHLGPTFEEAFNGYSKCVVIEASEGINPAISNHSKCALKPSSEFFNSDTIYETSVNVSLYHFLPGMLTGLGIFFTFVGLACGVSLATEGLLVENRNLADLSTVNSLRDSIGDLLKGAGQAFVSSIVGLLTSLIFSAWLYHRERLIQEAIHSLCQQLDKQTPYVSEQDLLLFIAKRAKDQEQTISDMKSGMDLWVDQLIEKFTSGFNQVTEKQTAALSESLAAIQTGLQELQQNQKDLSKQQTEVAVKVLGDALAANIEQMSQSFKETASGVGGAVAQLEVITNSTKSVMEEVFDQAQTSISETFDKARASVTDLNTQVNAAADKVRETGELLGDTLQQMSKVTATAVEAISSAGQDLSKAIIESSKEFKSEVTNGSEVFSNNVQTSGEKFGDAFQTAVDQGCGTLIDSFEQISGSTQKLCVGLASACQKHQELIDTYHTMGETVDDASKELNFMLKECRNTINLIVDKTNDISSTLATGMGEMLGTQQSIESSVKFNTELHAKAMEQTQKELLLCIDAQKSFQESSERLQKFLEAAVEGFSQAILKLHQGTENNLHEIDRLLAGSIDGMSETLADWLQNNNTVSKQLRETLDKHSQALNNLEIVSTQLRSSLEKNGRAIQNLEAVADLISGAAERGDA